MKLDHPIFTGLGRDFGVATVPQLRQHYFNGDEAPLRSLLRAAQERELVDVYRALIRRWTHDGAPLKTVLPGGEFAHLAGQLAYRAQAERWSAEISVETVVRARAKLTSLYRGEASVPASHLSHAVAVAEVFFQKRASDPNFEWSLIRSKPGNGALPDAIAGGLAIEIIGRGYGSASVALKLAISASMPLELW